MMSDHDATGRSPQAIPFPVNVCYRLKLKRRLGMHCRPHVCVISRPLRSVAWQFDWSTLSHLDVCVISRPLRSVAWQFDWSTLSHLDYYWQLGGTWYVINTRHRYWIITFHMYYCSTRYLCFWWISGLISKWFASRWFGALRVRLPYGLNKKN